MKCACGIEMKPLFSSLYCPSCEEDEEDIEIDWSQALTRAYAFIHIENTWILNNPTLNYVPAGWPIYLFKTVYEVKNNPIIGYSTARVDVTYEPNVAWSTIARPVLYTTENDLVFTII